MQDVTAGSLVPDMAYYQFTAPEYDDVLLDEGEFNSITEVEEAVNYLAEYHRCLVRCTHQGELDKTKSLLNRLWDKIVG